MTSQLQPIDAADFQAQCLELIDQVSQLQHPIIILKNGQAIARLVPIDPVPLFGALKGSPYCEGDIISPVWNS